MRHPGQYVSVGGASCHRAKGHWFNSQSEHMAGLQVQSLVRVCNRGNQLMFLSLSFSLPSLLSKNK